MEYLISIAIVGFGFAAILLIAWAIRRPAEPAGDKPSDDRKM
jgi:hypothetical protein